MISRNTEKSLAGKPSHNLALVKKLVKGETARETGVFANNL
jgi:hypothetical protein